MHRPAARLAAAFTIGLLWGAPAAAAAVGPHQTAEDGVLLAVTNPSQEAGHDNHTGGNGEVAEWPDWAHVDVDGTDGTDGTEEPADGGHAHDSETHGTGSHKAGEGEGSHGDHMADDHGAESGPSPERPRILVLGSFAAVNGAVLVTASLMRRRTQGEVARRASARASALRRPGPASAGAPLADPHRAPDHS